MGTTSCQSTSSTRTPRRKRRESSTRKRASTISEVSRSYWGLPAECQICCAFSCASLGSLQIDPPRVWAQLHTQIEAIENRMSLSCACVTFWEVLASKGTETYE